MIKAAILGASGYTGEELLRILALHPDVEVVLATSRHNSGRAVPEVFQSLAGFYDHLSFTDPSRAGDPGDPKEVAELVKSSGAGVVFSALPHGASMDVVPGLLEAGLKVVDLSADFRLIDPEIYKKWYGTAPPVIKDAVYGLPELHRDAIKDARLVANPGCYPTGAILALAPLVKLLDREKPVVIDSKSGASGAGRQPGSGRSANVETSFSEVNEGFKAYKVGSHRHTPEIVQELSILANAETPVTFTAHLLPVTRGILTTAYAWLGTPGSIGEVRAVYSDFYSKEPFVRLMPEGAFPDISQVRGSNYCDIGLYYDAEDSKVIVVSAIDNLVKGASGQAVQNMNIMCGLEETAALATPPV